MTQSGGAKNTFFSVILHTFQKSGRAIALPAPPPLQSLKIATHYAMSCIMSIHLSQKLTEIHVFKGPFHSIPSVAEGTFRDILFLLFLWI